MNPIPQPAPVQGDMDWFLHDRFGMFIHWGTYAAAARHEWVKHTEEIGRGYENISATSIGPL